MSAHTKITVRRVHIDSMGYESQGFHKGRYWGVGQPLYYCPELEALRDERPIRECNEPHCRASDSNAAHEIFVRRMTETLRLPTRKEIANREFHWRGL